MSFDRFQLEDDLIVLDDGDFTGSDSAAQDQINLTDLGFDEDEIMVIKDMGVYNKSGPGGFQSNADACFVIVTLNKSATATQPLADDVPIFIHKRETVLGAVANQVSFQHFEDLKHFPAAIFDHFYLHTLVKSGGSDGSGEIGIWIRYNKKKITESIMKDAVALLRMQSV